MHAFQYFKEMQMCAFQDFCFLFVFGMEPNCTVFCLEKQLPHFVEELLTS